MRRKPITRRLHCSAEGCNEWSFREYQNQREYAEDTPRVRDWKCTRHTGTVLLPASPIATWLSEPNGPSKKYPEIPRTTLFFGSNGFVGAGPIKAFSQDFPVGTRIKITMEAILPTEATHED